MPGPIVVPSLAGGSGHTRSTYRDLLGDELGVYRATSVATTASGGDPGRLILSDDFRDDGEESDDSFDRMYVYVVDGDHAGAQKRILSRGHQGRFGAAYLSSPFLNVASSPVALTEGTNLIVSSPLPVERIGRRKGLNQIAGIEALGLIAIEARLTLEGNGTRSIALDDYPWLRAREQITGIYDSTYGSASDPLELSGYGYRLSLNGVTRTLIPDLTYADAEEFQLGVVVRAHSLVNDGAGWGYVSGTGLLDDDSQAAADPQWVKAFGMVKALQHLVTLLDLDDEMDDKVRERKRLGYERRKQTWAEAAAEIKRDRFPSTVHNQAPVPAGPAFITSPASLASPRWSA